MAFNKSKALESALKFLNQGKVAQAIGEYQQILRHDPKDQATLMTVGDLFARQGDMTQAIEYFERLAQVYLTDGFNSKAIAIYKKIAKLAPAELAPLERLADLYVQQGVLSEARPLFLQIAEAHLKANRAQKGVEVLHRLLEVEPENPRVQMRLAELYNVMGQKKEAAQTYLNYAQRLFERSDNEEAEKLVDRALEVDGANPAAILLKGRILAALRKNDQAIKVLETHPEANAGGEVTDLVIDMELEAGHPAKAVDRARTQLSRGHAHFVQLHKVTDALIEAGQTKEALPLLGELREPMIEAGAQDQFLKSLTAATEKSPHNIEGLEMLIDFCRHTSDPFRLNAALGQLADACADQGNFARAEELLQELVDRNKNDERIVERLNQLRARAAGGGAPAETPVPELTEETAVPSAGVSVSVPSIGEIEMEPAAEQETPPAPAIVEEELDEETQRYVAQALTDVDLFSSYGLTQKATHLLENVLQRAPRHTPTLERLLDLYLGAGNERRTAETASLLEQIHRERNDTINADRFAELRRRFQKVAGISEDELPTAPPALAAAAPPAVPEAPEASEAQVSAPELEIPAESPAPQAPAVAPSAEFEIALSPDEPEPAEPPAVEIPAPASSVHAPQADAVPASQLAASTEEVDLSDEWEAMAREVAETSEDAAAPAPEEPAATPEPEVTPEPVAAHEPQAEPEPMHAAEPEPFEIQIEPGPVHEPEPAPIHDAVPEPPIELIEEPAAPEPAAEEVASGHGEFELELAPEPARPQSKGPLSTEDMISELVAEIDGMEAESPAAETPEPQPIASASAEPPKVAPPPPPSVAPASASVASKRPAAAPVAPAPPEAQEPVPQPTAESLNQLAEVFQEFRSELGEIADEDEDLETHYNLGIAYREMGLLEEAIGEFQKVAKAVQKGKPFPYSMNCSTLLALSFMDKGEPKIASLWYRRALETPDLEQESIMALRYDLGLALESAGEAKDALNSFQQVYAMNIDYRDVADRISALQKQESHV